MTGRTGHAIVVGGSMAGLLSARVLADRFEVVTLIERDDVPSQPAARKGVPQGRHAHGLLAAGEEVLVELFPGLVEDLVGGGATRVDFARGTRWYQFGGDRTSATHQALGATFMSRPFLEDAVRRRVEKLVNVTVRSAAVTGLVGRGEEVRGVRLADGSEVASDLVVDATGRGSQAPAWMEGLGFDAPAVSHVRIDMGYATRLLRRRAEATGAIITLTTPPDGKRGGVAFPIEDDRWIVTLFGFHGDHAATDDDGFLAFAESFPVDDIARVLRSAEPLTPVMTHRLPSNQWRHFERCKRVPAGFVAIGDSVCSFNPIYGQGMTSAALQVKALADALDRHPATSPRLPRVFYARAKKVVNVPWQIAAGADFMMPETTGPKPPMCDAINRYLAKAFVAAQHDAVVNDAIARVQNLLALPPTLMKPRLMARVLRGARRGPTGPGRATVPERSAA